MIPVLFGITVDGAVHLLATRGTREDMRSTLGAIFGALLTTGLGFGALSLADHPGLRSLSQLAVLGLSVSMLTTLVLLPAAIDIAARRRRRAES
jgi:predicted RND superfamily exporter protein